MWVASPQRISLPSAPARAWTLELAQDLALHPEFLELKYSGQASRQCFASLVCTASLSTTWLLFTCQLPLFPHSADQTDNLTFNIYSADGRKWYIPILPFLNKVCFTFDRLSLSVAALSIASCMPSGRAALDVRVASQLFWSEQLFSKEHSVQLCVQSRAASHSFEQKLAPSLPRCPLSPAH